MGLRIAQVAPLYERVPPTLYGGTERIVYFLTEELVRQGHEVTLFASGDSETSANLVSPCARSLRLDPHTVDTLAPHFRLLELVFERLDEFDIVHFHTDYLHFPLARRYRFARLTTLHGRLDIPELTPLYHVYHDEPVVSISDNQRKPLPHANWFGTVHHGLPPSLLTFNAKPEGYLAFLGRISPEKRVDRAIEIACSAGIPLKIAAKIDRTDRDYYHREIEPLMACPLVEFVGEIGESEKAAFLGKARALIFPIDWEEPFGLVMIEAMACGTPVVAFRRGSVPEIVEDGMTGFVVDTVQEAIEAVKQVHTLSRTGCRARFDLRYTVSRMALDYLTVYRRLLKEQEPDDMKGVARRAMKVVHQAAMLPAASGQ
jgi:glycosyltransferase involved in cell wall biosynthesis